MPSLKFALPIVALTIVGGWFLWDDAQIDLKQLFNQSDQAANYKSPYITESELEPKQINTTPPISSNQNNTTPTTQPPPKRPTPQPKTEPKPHQNNPQEIKIIGEKPNYDRKIIERAIGAAVNRQRLNRELNKLKWRKDLASVGRKFSRELVADAQTDLDKNEKLTKIPLRHDGAIFGDTNLNRLYNKEVFDFSTAGENIISMPLLTPISNGNYKWKTVEEIADESALRWTLSPTHMRNIVIARYTHTGVGAVLIDNFLVATQLFIAEVDCGYPDGKCCKPENDAEPLFCYGDNVCNRQKDDEMKCDLKNKE